MNSASVAFRLLCATCRWPRQNEIVSACAAQMRDEDWQYFLTLATVHRVIGLSAAALGAAEVTLPDAISEFLKAESHLIALGALAQIGENLRLQGVFEQSGIPTLTVKGVAVGQHVYGTAAVKQSRDIDLIIPEEHIPKAIAIAEADGYRLYSPAPILSKSQIAAFTHYNKEFDLRRPGRVALEIHSRLSDNPALLREAEMDWEGQSVTFGDRHHIQTLKDADLFAYLAVHGASHHWVRLKWLADFNALLAKVDNEDLIAAYYARAKAMGAGRPALQALMLCSELLGRPLPSALKPAAEKSHARALVQYSISAMYSEEPSLQRNIWQEVRDTLVKTRLGTGPRFWLGFVQAYGVQPSVILELDLPPRLFWLYPWIRPFFWVWFRLLSPKTRYRKSGKPVDTTP